MVVEIFLGRIQPHSEGVSHHVLGIGNHRAFWIETRVSELDHRTMGWI